jgi:glycine dehydrogenase subunit 1
MSFVPHSGSDVSEMLARVGASSVNELYSDIPPELLLERPLQLPDALSEWEAVRLLNALADSNLSLVCFAGAGQYDHHVPLAVDHLVRRSEFYTAYTPYQPEVSQGTLQSIYEFQTMICELMGMDVANASMYDGPSATAEAALMARTVTRRDGVLAAGSLHPHYRKVSATYLHGQGSELTLIPAGVDGLIDLEALSSRLDGSSACVMVQYPNFFGLVEELEPLAELTHEAGALLIVAVDPVALALLRPPGECGADIVVAEGQPFGNSPSFGGPVVGLFAARRNLVRKMPGRIVGATEDTEGRRGYVLTLQTREQQIPPRPAGAGRATGNRRSIAAERALRLAVSPRGDRRPAPLSGHCVRARVRRRYGGGLAVDSRARVRGRDPGRRFSLPLPLARDTRRPASGLHGEKEPAGDRPPR